MSDLKQDAEQLMQKTSQEALIAKQKAMSALNQEETWVEQNPKKVSAIILVLFIFVIAALAHSCS